ncbi:MULTISPECIES: hypothetical protein [unclassified Acinetobacter]|uniref:hypothetical protein n=1 Tax=unclassified Acinetobacter TaxID=196816 RepID=UPI002934D807|nr:MULTISPECIES: hypothetical protein [unclassified Acinetobacter]WOE32139.1 hypothetical protein QSG84_02695 [Acinetobacter sp. SAAs470]WOE37609.1 hypothetical protein QSG86_11740 [Acinetobacter sp. SAAs474]
MDIKNTMISAKVVIKSLIVLLENENVDISSIKFKINNTENGSESESLSFQNLVEVTLEELDEAKAQKVAVPEGFVLVEKSKIESLCDYAYEAKQYSADSFAEIKHIEKELQAMIEAQEQV